MNASDNHAPNTSQLSGAVSQKCFICGDPVGENCFCRIPDAGGPIMLCCPGGVIQYCDAAQNPEAIREQNLGASENGFHFFVGENKPWL